MELVRCSLRIFSVPPLQYIEHFVRKDTAFFRLSSESMGDPESSEQSLRVYSLKHPKCWIAYRLNWTHEALPFGWYHGPSGIVHILASV